MLKIENLSKSFGDKQVIRNLNLEVADGSIFGLVGINGAGKSSLLRLISGVYRADEGVVLLDGEDTFSNETIRNRIAYVSDEAYFPFSSTVASMKAFYEALYDFDQAAYEKYREMFELDENKPINNFSKGMKRRVELLFALSTRPKLILLDEAYDGLEPLARLRFKKALMDLIEEGVSVIISGHNLKELEDICDSFGILEDGRISSYGDLLQSKESVNKYQLAFKEDYNRDAFKDFDVIHYEREGQVYKLVIRGDKEEITEQLSGMKPILLNILNVNFEELFIYELESRGEAHE